MATYLVFNGAYLVITGPYVAEIESTPSADNGPKLDPSSAINSPPAVSATCTDVNETPSSSVIPPNLKPVIVGGRYAVVVPRIDELCVESVTNHFRPTPTPLLVVHVIVI